MGARVWGTLPELKHDIWKDQVTINYEILISTKYSSISHMTYDNIKIVFLISGKYLFSSISYYFLEKFLREIIRQYSSYIWNRKQPTFITTHQRSSIGVFQVVCVSVCPRGAPVRRYGHNALWTGTPFPTQTCLNLYNLALTVQGTTPPRHIQTCILCSSYCRQAGDWHSIEMSPCLSSNLPVAC